MNSIDFKFPFLEGDMVKWLGKLWYVLDVHTHDIAAIASFQSVENPDIIKRFEFGYLELRRKDFVDSMKPSEEEEKLAGILFDEFHEGYFLGMDHTLDAMRYMIAGIKGQGSWYKNDT